ncbi:MAG: septal ring lytic transglycosylase RlpA family protein [Methylococcales bacterium]|nr:septal ring lytic transglycosylase RlpA family protein [Methylococcales bacterium]
MKKLIPILSVAVLSSCSNTTFTKANLVPVLQDEKLAEINPPPLPVHYTPKPSNYIETNFKGKKDKGVASWYGNSFHGKKTATGEYFDMYGMTAAHNSLPLDSYAQITNMKNHKTVIVRINDRGPFYDHRVLDLSYSAAKQLGMDTTGTSKVEIKTIAPQQALAKLQEQNQSVYLQLGSFRDKKLAEALLKNLKKQHLPEPKLAASSHNNATLYKVQLPIQSANNANELNLQLAKIGITHTKFVTETN